MSVVKRRDLPRRNYRAAIHDTRRSVFRPFRRARAYPLAHAYYNTYITHVFGRKLNIF